MIHQFHFWMYTQNNLKQGLKDHVDSSFILQ